MTGTEDGNHCWALYPNSGPGDRIVHCGLVAGHDGLHAEDPGAPEWESAADLEAADAIARRDNDAAKALRDRDELRERRNEDMAIRGVLSPSECQRLDRIIPFDIGPSVVPAVEWLVAERDAMRSVVDAAKAWRAQFTKPSVFPRIAALFAAVDAYDMNRDSRITTPAETLVMDGDQPGRG